MFGAIFKKYNIHCIVEHHQQQENNIKKQYKKFDKDIFFNPATLTGRSELGTHGGEYIAVDKYLRIKTIPNCILKAIEA